MYKESSQSNSKTIQRAKKFTVDVIHLCDAFPSKRPAWIVADQLIRSASSIGANIVEAQASTSRKEFKKFLEIALKSSNETIYWLEISQESNLSANNIVSPLLDEVTQLSKILGRSVITLKSVVSKSL